LKNSFDKTEKDIINYIKQQKALIVLELAKLRISGKCYRRIVLYKFLRRIV